MTWRAPHQSRCEAREIRRVRSEPPPRPASDEPNTVIEDRTFVVEEHTVVEDVTVRTAAPVDTDATRLERPRPSASPRVFTPPRTDYVPLDHSMIEDLRRRLREAEARESAPSSGSRGAAPPSSSPAETSEPSRIALCANDVATAPREGSGIRARPTPDEGLPARFRETLPTSEQYAPSHDDVERWLETAFDPIEDLDIDIGPPVSFDEWVESIGALPEVEVALAPHSESNFYGGFDETQPDGVFVATYRDLPVDTPVYAVVHLPGGYRFRTPALVEFVREPEAATVGLPAGVGLRMCGLDGRMRRMIRAFAKHRPPMFYVD